MSRTIMLIPTGTNVSPASISPGVVRAMGRKSIRLNVFKPTAQPRTGNDAPDQTTTIVCANSLITTAAEPLKMSYVEGLPSSNQEGALMGEIIANYHANTKDAEIVLVEGLVPIRRHQFAQPLNHEIVKALNAEIIFVMSQGTNTSEQLKECIELTRNDFGDARNTNIAGVIVNKLGALINRQGHTHSDLSEISDDSTKVRVDNVDPAKLQGFSPLPVLGAMPWSFDPIVTRAIGMARHLNAATINEGDISTRRVKPVTLCARNIPHMLKHSRADSLLVTSIDRPDALIAAYLAAMNGVEIGTLLLTGGHEMDARVSELRERAFATDLPVFMVNTSTWQTSLNLQSFNLEAPVNDHEHIEEVQEYVANYINANWIDSLTATSECSRRLSPPTFRHQLTGLARRAGKCIALPEGDEPHTAKATAIYAERGIVARMLLGNPVEINCAAVSQGVELGAGIEIVDLEVVRENYVGRLIELRKSKGMIEAVTRKQLEDNVVPGTLMLEQDEAGGLVSSAVHTTVSTIRSPLQLVKTAPGSSLVSSVFFALLPEQVYVYGSYAISPDPTAERLAEIVIQFVNSVAVFGIEPHVAMFSYSVGTSGVGSDVEEARGATRLAQEKRPGLMIDGPLRYNAAVMANVAKSKAPNSPVVGRTTVFVFPDLNTGNTIYKVVQRSTDLISIGPMLRGTHKPVNNLSRGALVDDIVYTIALTAAQSAQQQ